MKLAAIKKCCMATGQFLVLRTPEGCWLSNGWGCWPTDGIEIREGDIPAVFDIAAKQRDKLLITGRMVEDERLTLAMAPHEEELQLRGHVWDGGQLYAVLEDRRGTARLVNAAWLRPAENRDVEMRYFARPGERGEWVAAFGDLLTAAIVTPEPAERAEAIMERVRGLARLPLSGLPEAQG